MSVDHMVANDYCQRRATFDGLQCCSGVDGDPSSTNVCAEGTTVAVVVFIPENTTQHAHRIMHAEAHVCVTRRRDAAAETKKKTVAGGADKTIFCLSW